MKMAGKYSTDISITGKECDINEVQLIIENEMLINLKFIFICFNFLCKLLGKA